MAFGCNHCRAILLTEAREVKRWSDGLKKARRPSQIRIAKDMEPLWHRRCAKLYNHSPYFVVWTTSCRLLIFTFSEKGYPPPKKKRNLSYVVPFSIIGGIPCCHTYPTYPCPMPLLTHPIQPPLWVVLSPLNPIKPN